MRAIILLDSNYDFISFAIRTRNKTESARYLCDARERIPYLAISHKNFPRILGNRLKKLRLKKRFNFVKCNVSPRTSELFSYKFEEFLVKICTYKQATRKYTLTLLTLIIPVRFEYILFRQNDSIYIYIRLLNSLVRKTIFFEECKTVTVVANLY